MNDVSVNLRQTSEIQPFTGTKSSRLHFRKTNEYFPASQMIVNKLSLSGCALHGSVKGGFLPLTNEVGQVRGVTGEV